MNITSHPDQLLVLKESSIYVFLGTDIFLECALGEIPKFLDGCELKSMEKKNAWIQSRLFFLFLNIGPSCHLILSDSQMKAT